MTDSVPEISALGPVADLGLHPQQITPGARCETHSDRDACFRCATCKAHRCEACLFGRLGAREVCRTCSKDGLDAPIPWELRAERGVIRTLLETVRLVCLSPVRFFRTPKLEDDAVGAFELGMICFGIGQVAVVLQALAIALLASGMVALNARMPVLLAAAGGYGCVLLGAIPAMLVHVPVTAILSVGAASLGTHGTLRVFGQARAPFFAGTVRGMSYAFATQVFMIVPFVGALVALIWMLVLEVIAIREEHRTSTLVATVAVLGYRVLFYGAIVAIYVAIMGAAVAASLR